MTEQASRRIYWMRLICAIMVIGIHCENSVILNQSAESWSSICQAWITNNIYCIAVPVFFMLSGFFCYYHVKTNIFLERWKKRIAKTIYLYLAWNAFYTIYHMAVLFLKSGMEGIQSAGLKAIIMGLFLYEFNDPWWFMFQLLILELCAPVILRALQGEKSRIILALAICLLATIQGFCLFDNKYIRTDAYVWYLVGAYIGYLCPEWLTSNERGKAKIGITLLLLGEVGLLICNRMSGYMRWMPILVLAVGFVLICKLGKYTREISEIFKSTFFIYAVHPLLVSVLYKCEEKLIPINEWSSFALFLLNPCIVTVIALCGVWVAKKIKVYHLLTLE